MTTSADATSENERRGGTEPQRDWAAYYAKTRERPPRETVVRALDAFDREELARDARLAVDLGCGGGRDIPALLDRSWRVVAIDRAAEAEEGIRNRPDIAAEQRARIEFRLADFLADDFAVPPAPLVISSFALFMCPPARFAGVWRRIEAALPPGGRFAGHLLGPNDTWAQPGERHRDLVYPNRAALDRLLEPFEIDWLREEEDDAVTPHGEAKHWHVWHIVARKRPA